MVPFDGLNDAGGVHPVDQAVEEIGRVKAVEFAIVNNIAEAITINISGGIASGDSLATDIEIGAGAAVSITSQAAERIYRALDFLPARLQTTITLGAGAMLDYLPQETILFDGFALDRSLDIELAEDADFLGVK